MDEVWVIDPVSKVKGQVGETKKCRRGLYYYKRSK